MNGKQTPIGQITVAGYLRFGDMKRCSKLPNNYETWSSWLCVRGQDPVPNSVLFHVLLAMSGCFWLLRWWPMKKQMPRWLLRVTSTLLYWYSYCSFYSILTRNTQKDIDLGVGHIDLLFVDPPLVIVLSRTTVIAGLTSSRPHWSSTSSIGWKKQPWLWYHTVWCFLYVPSYVSWFTLSTANWTY